MLSKILRNLQKTLFIGVLLLLLALIYSANVSYKNRNHLKVFSCEFYNFFFNIYSLERLRTDAFDISLKISRICQAKHSADHRWTSYLLCLELVFLPGKKFLPERKKPVCTHSEIMEDPFSTYATFFEKISFLIPRFAHVRMRVRIRR